MSGVPPNYDPSASMLQGGTNSVIQPVMGGGGGAPPDYNANVSMLTGGTEPMVKILGGGAKGQKSLGKLQGEVYELLENDRVIQYRNQYLQNLTQNYINKRGDLEVRLGQFIPKRLQVIQRYTTGGVAQPIQIPTLAQPQTTSMIYDVLPPDLETLIMIPPVHGDPEKFIGILQYLFKTDIFRKENSGDLRLKNGVGLICMAPFYADVAVEQLILLTYLQMRIWDANQDSFFVLNDPSSVNVGTKFYDFANFWGFDSTNPFPGNQENYLINFLNPSHIICKKPFGRFKGIVLSSESGQIPEPPHKDRNAAFSLPSEIMKTHTTFGVNASVLREDTDTNFNDYLIIGSRGYKAELIQPRTDVPICKGLLTIFYDEDFPPDKNIYHIANKKEYIHVFRFDRIQEPPLLCLDDDGGITTAVPPPGDFASKENHPRFAKGATQKIVVDAIERNIRIPTAQVFQNWNEGIYSKEEADFLNSLQLNPSILGFVFDADWKLETANFLKRVVLSRCFTDVRVITTGECDSVRRFLNKVLDYFYAHAAYKMEDAPIQRIVLPKFFVEEEPAILEPPPVLPLPPLIPIGSIAWPANPAEAQVIDILESDFEKENFGAIELEIKGDNYFIDFIVVQRYGGDKAFKRLLMNIKFVKATALQQGIREQEVLANKMDEFKQNFIDFIFIY